MRVGAALPAAPRVAGSAAPSVLVQAARGGDLTAWRVLMDRYSPMMWGVTRRFRLDHATRADVVQSAWVALAEHLDNLRDPDALGGWLASTVRRACMRELTRRKRIDLRSSFVEREVVDPAPPPDVRAATRDRDDRLWRAFRRLPQRDQQLLRLLWSAPPRPYTEIATVMDVPVGSIGPTRARALRRLREQLVLEGIDDPTADVV